MLRSINFDAAGDTLFTVYLEDENAAAGGDCAAEPMLYTARRAAAFRTFDLPGVLLIREGERARESFRPMKGASIRRHGYPLEVVLKKPFSCCKTEPNSHIYRCVHQ